MRRSTLSLALTLTLLLAAAPAARAARTSSPETGKLELAITPTFALPTGDWSSVSSVGIGASFDAIYRLQPKLSLTGSLGYIYFFDKTVMGIDVGTSTIPLLVGVKYDVTPKFFVTGEVGLADDFARAELSGFGSSSASRIGFSLAAGAGYDFGPVALTGRFFGTDFGGDQGLDWALLVGLRIPIAHLL